MSSSTSPSNQWSQLAGGSVAAAAATTTTAAGVDASTAGCGQRLISAIGLDADLLVHQRASQTAAQEMEELLSPSLIEATMRPHGSARRLLSILFGKKPVAEEIRSFYVVCELTTLSRELTDE